MIYDLGNLITTAKIITESFIYIIILTTILKVNTYRLLRNINQVKSNALQSVCLILYISIDRAWIDENYLKCK